MIFHSYVNVETRGYDGMMEPTVVKKGWTTMKDTGFTHSQCWFKMVWLDLNLSNMKKTRWAERFTIQTADFTGQASQIKRVGDGGIGGKKSLGENLTLYCLCWFVCARFEKKIIKQHHFSFQVEFPAFFCGFSSDLSQDFGYLVACLKCWNGMRWWLRNSNGLHL